MLLPYFNQPSVSYLRRQREPRTIMRSNFASNFRLCEFLTLVGVPFLRSYRRQTPPSS